MGFQGLIISDDLGMAAVSETMPWQDLPLRALRAGVDLLLICHQRQRQEEAHASLLGAVQRGEVAPSLVEGAVSRVRKLKSRLCGLLQDTVPAFDLACLGSSEQRALIASVHERSVQQARRKGSHDDRPVVG
jgi:beta-N-acetylhexosaminidase